MSSAVVNDQCWTCDVGTCVGRRHNVDAYNKGVVAWMMTVVTKRGRVRGLNSSPGMLEKRSGEGYCAKQRLAAWQQIPFVLSSVALCWVMREGGMILIILSPTGQLVTVLKLKQCG